MAAAFSPDGELENVLKAGQNADLSKPRHSQ
jgi:hypothetical protein